jgi:hypothetical protein
VLQLKRKNANMMNMPPIMAATERGCPVRNQSTIATRKIVRSAATEERTGDVREIRTRKDPENAGLG